MSVDVKNSILSISAYKSNRGSYCDALNVTLRWFFIENAEHKQNILSVEKSSCFGWVISSPKNALMYFYGGGFFTK